jgi:hypothetical protein
MEEKLNKIAIRFGIPIIIILLILLYLKQDNATNGTQYYNGISIQPKDFGDIQLWYARGEYANEYNIEYICNKDHEAYHSDKVCKLLERTFWAGKENAMEKDYHLTKDSLNNFIYIKEIYTKMFDTTAECNKNVLPYNHFQITLEELLNY